MNQLRFTGAVVVCFCLTVGVVLAEETIHLREGGGTGYTDVTFDDTHLDNLGIYQDDTAGNEGNVYVTSREIGLLAIKDLFTELPATSGGCDIQINSATLYLTRYNSGSSSDYMRVYRCTTDWLPDPAGSNEDDVSFDHAEKSESTTWASGDFSSSDYDDSVCDTSSWVDSYNEVAEIDVTNVLQEIYDAETNYGFVLLPSSGASLNFRSSEQGTASRRPSLEITYEYVGTTYTLTVNSGTGDGDYTENTQVDISADTAPSGQEFDEWVGDTSGIASVTSASTTLTMPAADQEITATYTDKTWTLTVNSGTGDGSYVVGTVVDIDADTAPSGQDFDEWTGDTSGIASVTSASTTLTMPYADAEITATYADKTWTLTVNSGSGDGDYVVDTVVNISADTAPSGKQFDKWVGDTSGIASVTSASTTLTMPYADAEITATYADAEGGTTQLIVDWGDSEANNVYDFSDWDNVYLGPYQYYSSAGPDGIVGSTTDNYTVCGVNGSSESFSEGDKIVVTWYNNTGSSVTFTPKVSFDDEDYWDGGSSSGTWYDMTQLQLDDGETGTTGYTFTSGSAGTYNRVHVCRALNNTSQMLCDKIQLVTEGGGTTTYTLTVNSGTGDGSYAEDTVVDITADSAASGKQFDEWVGDTSGIASVTSASTTLTMPAANQEVTATYTDKTWTLTVNNGSGDGTYAESTVVYITADTAPSGKFFDRWVGDTSGIADINDPSTTLTMPASDVEITAGYAHVAADLVSRYTFDIDARDTCGTNDGTLTGGASVTTDSVRGKVLSLDGIDDYVSLPSTAMAAGRSEVTLTLWVKPDEWVSSNTIYDEYAETNYWQFTIREDEFMTRDSSTGTMGSRDNDLAMPSAATGEWHHLAFVYSVSGGKKEIYYDGAIHGTTGTSIDTLTSTRDGAAIGYACDGDYYDGLIDDVRLYGRALTAEEISLIAENPLYTLTVNSGTGDGDYVLGQVVDIAADTAPSGYEFDEWTGDTSGVADTSDPTTTYTMPGQDAEITATYSVAPTYSLTVNSGTGDGSYAEGTVVNISADAPASGKQFDQWVGDTSGIASVTSSSTTLTMPAAAQEITATYEDIVTYTLTVNSGSGDGSYQAGTVVDIQADAPASGYDFDKWTGDTSNIADVNAASTTITMGSADAEITATYASGYTLTVNSGSGDGVYASGTIVDITANSPPSGQVFDAWIGDTSGIADVNDETTTITMPASDAEITATYQNATLYTLTVNSGSGDGSYQADWVVSISADSPPEGKAFDEWVGDTGGIANVNASSTTLTMPASSQEITATYADVGSSPSVSGVSGSITQGSTITISGSGFGTGPSGVVFDDFEGGTDGNSIMTGAGSATVGGWDSTSYSNYYTDDYSVSGSLAFEADMGVHYLNYVRRNFPSGTSEVFACWWVRIPDPMPGEGNPYEINWKHIWFQGATATDDDLYFIYFHDLPGTIAHIGGNCGVSDGWMWSYGTWHKGDWIRGWIYVKGGITDGHYDVEMLHENGTRQSWSVDGQTWGNDDYLPYQYESVRFNAYGRQTSGSYPVHDDCYSAYGPNCRARVVIGNNSNYASCTDLAICGPTSWSSSSITAKCNIGGLDPADDWYLFVINGSNQESTGYKIN